MNKTFPSIVIAIPTYNEEVNIGECISSILSQKYPHKKIEIIIIDNNSTDDTVKIASKFPIKIMFSSVKDSQISKRIIFDKTKSDLFMYFDADMRMSNSEWLRKMTKPLVEDQEIVGSLVNYTIKGDESLLTKFLIFDPVARDPIYQFFSIDIKKTVVEHKKGYDVCVLKKDKIPSQGLGVFRREALKKSVKFQGNKFMDLDNIAHLVNLGYNKFAWVNAGTYHYFMPNLVTLIKKRLRNIKKNYLNQDFKRSYTWFSFKKPKDILKIFFWVIYANLVIPELVRGIYKSVKYKSWAGLYQPVVSFIETNVIILGLVWYWIFPPKFHD